MSLDGFIAGADGDMSWLADYLAPNPTVDDLVGQIGALLVGNRTYRGDDPYKDTRSEGQAFGGAWSGPQFVLTHHPPNESVQDTTFVTDLATAVDLARRAAGDKYVNVLGADVARQCLDAGVLDEILVCIVPVMLGEGVRLFERKGAKPVRLEPIGVTSTDVVVNVWMRVTR